MKRFERFRRCGGLSLEQAARLWADGVRSPETFLARADDEEGRAMLRRQLGADDRGLAALVEVARRVGTED